MKKGFIDPGTDRFISLLLIIVFVIFAFLFYYTSLGPKTIDALNYAGSKVGIAINPAKLGILAPQGTQFAAKITLQPGSPVCSNELVYFSANGTSLPSGLTIQNASCYWDFDTASEPCDAYTNSGEAPPSNLICTPGEPANNSDTTDDYEATTCDTVSNGTWLSSDTASNGKKHAVELVVVAGGKTSVDTTPIKSTLGGCACAGVSPGCGNDVVVSPQLPTNILKNQGTLNVSFSGLWTPADIHLVLEPVGEVSDLKIGVGTYPAYQMKGNLTDPTVVYGQSLLSHIEQQMNNCAQDTCPVTLSFYFSGTGHIIVKEIWMPLN